MLGNRCGSSFSYDDGGRRTRTTWPGDYADYQYNARDWITVLNRTTGGATQYLARYYYQDGSLWDHAGNPLKKTEDWGAGDQPTTFRYDHVYRLTEETKRNVDLSVVFSRTYGYDPVGNRTSMTADGVGYTYVYDDNDKLTGVSGGGQSASMGYDLNGNMTSVSGTMFGSKTLVYDDESRPTSITSGGVTDQYWYNTVGQRMRAVLNGATVRYVYNGERVLQETDDAGVGLGCYTTESGSYYAPLWHIQRGDGTSRFPLYEGIGTARRLVTSAGLKTDAYSLDAFGRAFAPPTQPTPNPYRFGGAWGYITDTPGSGMLQLGARFYWPEVGRFIQQDPIGDGINWYAYVGDNPLVWADPEGLDVTIPWFGGEPWLVFDPGSLDQLGMSAGATLTGLVNGGSLGVVPLLKGLGVLDPRFADWTDPCDPYASFSKGAGAVGGAALTIAGGLGVAKALGAPPKVVDPWLGAIQKHGPHHVFRILGREFRARHIQIMIRRAVRGKSPWTWRIPYWWR